MTFTRMTNNLADLIIQDRAYANEHRIISGKADFTEYDKECAETVASQLRRLFIDSNGCKWDYVLNGIKLIADSDFYLGFKAQDQIINICNTYGINFVGGKES